MKPYSTTAQVLNQAIAELARTASWNTSEPGTVIIQDITYTALSTGGAAAITVAYVPAGTSGHEAVTVTGNAISVKIASGVSTATQVLAAINATPAALLLVYPAITGTAGTAQVVTTAPVIVLGDVWLRIVEADNEIDSRLAGMGISLPFASNPPALQDLSVMYARYACLRDLYTGTNPQANSESAKNYLDRFENKWLEIKQGWQAFVDSAGAPVNAGKFTPQTVDYPKEEHVTDNYPRAPYGPPPELPDVWY